MDDYVVVKVDIEGGPELNIVESIAHIPELSQLVDELYFEYHFRFWEVPHPWGNTSFGGDLAIPVGFWCSLESQLNVGSKETIRFTGKSNGYLMFS